jgi:hypothetical protein
MKLKISLELCLVAVDFWISSLVIISCDMRNIDLMAYVMQSQTFLKGEMDYSRLVGNTGGVQYPALCVYIYAFLSTITDHFRGSWFTLPSSPFEDPR